MKPLERQFFRYCMRQIDYTKKYYSVTCTLQTTRGIWAILQEFADKKQCSEKQLIHYLMKWSELGFYDYGVNIGYGWFYVHKMAPQYTQSIPKRVRRKLVNILKGGIKNGNPK